MKVTGYDGSTQGDVYIQTLDEFGRDTGTYTWYDYTSKKTGAKFYGWYNDDDELIDPEVVTFQAGEGIWAYCDGDGFQFQSAGQVATSKVVVELQDGGLSVANPTPVTIDLTDCTISGYEDSTQGDVYIQTLDEFGRDTATYTWYDYTSKKTGKEFLGWFNDDDELIEKETVTMAPGVGIWAYCDGDGFTFEFPGVDVK